MARFEEEQNYSPVEKLEDEVEQLKRNLKRKQNKKIFGCGSCLIIALVVVLVLAYGTAYVLAKSGLKELPYFTKVYFKEPQPSHVVDTHKMTESDTDFVQLLQTAVKKEVAKTGVKAQIPVSLKISEAQLSAWLSQNLKDNADLSDKVQLAQIAVLSEELEVFIKSPKKLFIILRLKPELVNGAINLKPKSLQIGNLALPAFISNFTVGTVVEKSLNSALAAFSQFGQFKSLELKPPAVNINLIINSLKGLQ